MSKKVLTVALTLISIIYVVMMSVYWVFRDTVNLTKSESSILFAAGSLVILGWILLPRKGRSR